MEVLQSGICQVTREDEALDGVDPRSLDSPFMKKQLDGVAQVGEPAVEAVEESPSCRCAMVGRDAGNARARLMFAGQRVLNQVGAL